VKFFRAETFSVLFLGIFAVSAFAASAQPLTTAAAVAIALEQRGAQIFQRERCFFCHSTRAQLAAPPRVTFPLGYVERVAWQWARNGPDLTRTASQRANDWQRAHLINPGAIMAGCPMPSYAYLPNEDLESLIAFIQKQGQPAPQTTPTVPGPRPIIPATRESYLAGRALYQIYCAGCHGRQGNGAGPVGHLLQPEPRDFTDAAWMRKRDDDYLFRVTAQGKADTAMPGYDGILTAREEALVLYYLKFFADPSAQQAMEEGFGR